MTDLGFVHRFVPGSDSSLAAVLLLLHGTGGDENDLIPLGESLVPGAAMLSLRGKVLENGMPRFFRRLSEGVFDLEDLKQRTEELARFIERARERYSLHGKTIAVGYSNGANIASSLILRFPNQLAAAVLLRAMVPFTPDTLPDLRALPILLSAGERDPVVPTANTRRLVDLFERSGAEVSIHWHPGGHNLGRDDLETAKIWLGHLLRPGEIKTARARPTAGA